MNNRLCIDCHVPMKKALVNYKEIQLEARECPKCKEKIFTEDLAMKAISQLEEKQLDKEYIKHPIRIGHSWGITFPKALTKVFDLENPKKNIRLHPNIREGKVEMEICN